MVEIFAEELRDGLGELDWETVEILKSFLN